MEQNVYIQMIWKDKFETHTFMQNCKRVWISDDIWKDKLEGCRWKQINGKTKCVKTTGLIGVVRGHA